MPGKFRKPRNGLNGRLGPGGGRLARLKAGYPQLLDAVCWTEKPDHVDAANSRDRGIQACNRNPDFQQLCCPARVQPNTRGQASFVANDDDGNGAPKTTVLSANNAVFARGS